MEASDTRTAEQQVVEFRTKQPTLAQFVDATISNANLAVDPFLWLQIALLVAQLFQSLRTICVPYGTPAKMTKWLTDSKRRPLRRLKIKRATRANWKGDREVGRKLPLAIMEAGEQTNEPEVITALAELATIPECFFIPQPEVSKDESEGSN